MQPLGRKKLKGLPYKVDGHFGKGIKNWWEVVVEPSVKSYRQYIKRLIKNDIKESA
jgi:hypothetical protein